MSARDGEGEGKAVLGAGVTGSDGAGEGAPELGSCAPASPHICACVDLCGASFVRARVLQSLAPRATGKATE
jgi:hypothetical protein